MEEKQIITNLKKGSSVLVTGGSGLIGRYLTSLLLSEGYNVSHLSRQSTRFGKVNIFQWDPEKEILDPFVLEGIDCIVHLSGANIGEKRWSEKRKSEIVNSRVDSAKLLFNRIRDNGIKLKSFISASAVGYYGSITSDNIFSEEDSPGTDFLGSTCRKWEEGADLFRNYGIRTVKIRTSVVLEKNDSALSKLIMPAKFGFLVQTGNGKQYMPWIHIHDLCQIYLKAIEDQDINGAYNAVSPHQITQKEFIETLARVMGKPLIPVPLPSFLIRAVLGEMSDVVLKGSRISSAKLINSGFDFIFQNTEKALKNVLGK